MFNFLLNAQNRNFLRLWLAQLISQFGDRIYQLALVGLIAEKAPGSATQLAKLLAFTIIPVFIVQPFAGVWVDRWDRRTTLFICDILRGLLVLTIPFIFIFWDSMAPIYAAVFLVFCFSRFYVPAKMSIIPDLVEDEHLMMANSLVTTTGMVAFVMGCALGGFLVDHYGARTGFLIDAGAFFISAAFVFSIDLSLKLRINKTKFIKAKNEIVQTFKKSIWLEMREAFHYLREHKEIRFIIGVLFTLLSAAGAIYVVIIIFIQQSFQSVTKDLGILAVALGLGLLLGALIYGKWGKRLMWYNTIFLCLVLGGVMLIFFALLVHYYTDLYLAIVLSIILGIILGPVFIASNTVVHLVSDNEMRGKVFSALEMVIHFAFLIAMMISSILAEMVPRVWILVGVGAVFALMGISGFFKARRGAFAFSS